MAILSGTNHDVNLLHPVKLMSVLITSDTGNPSNVEIYNGGDTTAQPEVVLRSPAGVTSQYYFNNVDFPNGMTIVPSIYVDSFLVEYG